MRKLVVLLAAAVIAGPGLAQTPSYTPPAAGTVKAVQPGLFEVAGQRINDAVTVGITKITATPGKGGRSESPWGFR